MLNNQKRIEVLRTVPTSVRQAIRGMLHEEKRRRVEEGHDVIDVNRAHKKALERLDNGTLSECIHCTGIITMERSFTEDNLFTTTCSDKCSYELVMEALEKKITDTALSIAPKAVSAKQDMCSNEAAGDGFADSFISQDINIRVLQTSQKLLECLRERRVFLLSNPGYFNICAGCGEKIPTARLIHSPESGMCRSCKPNTRDTRTNGKSTVTRIGNTI